ncbi:universal stress protein [Pelagibius sp. Alg239-R121]|uniref:universal stress protein n=1 Tax=Pelagibius sp. Alg239-R121 TaxID=2993448 RepID=UPI0024A6D578|nr:universal stress protein [Pelagibius sp. Alg239-R121]
MDRTVLVCVDTSDPDCWPALLADVLHSAVTGATLHMVHVVPEEEALGPLSQFVPEGFADAHRATSHSKLETMSKDLPSHVDIKLHMRSGNIYVEALNLAEKIEADLIIIGSSRPDLRDYLLGPKAARIVRHAKCSVLVVRS